MATMRRLKPEQYGERSPEEPVTKLVSALSTGTSTPTTLVNQDSKDRILLSRRKTHWELLCGFITLRRSDDEVNLAREKPTLACVKAHMKHAVIVSF